MARRKNDKGLTHQQELFCQYMVDAYGDNQERIQLTAYRMAYNCKSDNPKAYIWQSSEASKLMNDPKITQRISELEGEQAELLTLTMEEIVSNDVKAYKLDPLMFLKWDGEAGRYRPRRLEEFPKSVRVLLRSSFVNGIKVYHVDKDRCLDRIINLLQLKTDRTEIIHNSAGGLGELRIGFSRDLQKVKWEIVLPRKMKVLN